MEIIFKSNTLFSDEFGDFYFNKSDPLGQSSYVFISAIDEIWDKKDSFIVAECGFGIGLNFLNLASRFENTTKTLHYVSIEKYPFSKENLAKIYQKMGVFDKFSKRLIKKYPIFKDGLCRIYFSKNIILDIYFDDVKVALKNLDFKADIWFMDGFSASKNPQMWDLETIFCIKNLMLRDGILRTYSSTKSLKENLKNANFIVDVLKGFGLKREMISAKLIKEDEFKKEIYYSRPLVKKNLKNVLIIGAGVAGLISGFKFKKAGFNVLIAEKESEVATNGSGNLVGALMPLITQKGVSLGKFHVKSFLMAGDFYKKFAKKFIKFSGAKDFAFDEKLIKRYQNSDFVLNLKDHPYPSVFIKNAATIRPKHMCEYFASLLRDEILLNYEFINFKKVDDGYEVSFKNGDILKTDIIIFATGSHSEELFNKGENPKINLDDSVLISSVRGQVTHIKKQINTEFIINAKGYICPSYFDLQIIGATYDRGDYTKFLKDLDDIKNLESIKEFIDKKDIKFIGSKVGFRSYSGDRFPLIGGICDVLWFKKNYSNLLWNKHKTSNLYPKYLENIYINSAHGSRGLGSAVLGAEILLDLVLNRPFCIDKNLVDEVNPARFLIRRLKKGFK
ncbi:bifunctional tRNA (5-methylaminomethyl-2-thiouridine)(34)-methyltransferase MnmD/FAD-dependent 5-carboxymethylaminomethyl-2-thiouridine(34) oxidoreductase MnmC [Campylobacter sp. FMV-PI01]|uniref:Bifunctional tRNA (5-methylaminomethyl-2-thiouridine)(34)-methyltransferase MnmD/FAD-dependent 5-carboxymethylaminomethyl-2-thiouridine(34) oxidoreductase MnmC n=1 Tax=Campylobacter portucalensis TaxID=2608384 RepID=A0A6L5WKE5_9BACT|nr:bifunctional tRNA (5-methylaminomethyl-2-thiouridine)(34)-methyltransferase MnmD/FAD-dependent 5-carboxymethylaminomethyl-2-thiouridine(34) oxidoreductase MnmC [Campylobacter portucalensis]MSN96485.1 bifunctional tRNA (5-methylaminomethyl-2-thiouridine)(34)-methyltransferase MnmD/FAD-dependent 5-carboxymethylaminomethyl-2-thiouridine(34) oxidoreductase MnmC [Campylobacter portucalensis]